MDVNVDTWQLRVQLGLLDAMQQAGLQPNLISYSAAISACAKGGSWARALSLLAEMRTAGHEPNVISYSAAMSACDKGGQWAKALALLREMLHLVRTGVPWRYR
jgi:pentatricopeptide repeat domain-containing protein 1